MTTATEPELYGFPLASLFINKIHIYSF